MTLHSLSIIDIFDDQIVEPISLIDDGTASLFQKLVRGSWFLNMPTIDRFLGSPVARLSPTMLASQFAPLRVARIPSRVRTPIVLTISHGPICGIVFRLSSWLERVLSVE